jgi:hypothetical protein
MAAPNTTQTPAAPAETIDYQPLSLLAVAGLALGVVYGVILAITGIAALLKAEPFFLPGWLLFVPLLAAALSGAGLWEIYNSEGTRAGGKLARWGLGLSIVLALCYITYTTFTGLAIVSQANRFMLEKGPDAGFFPLLIQGDKVDARTAFYLTLTGPERLNVRPTNERDMERFDQPNPQNMRGRLTTFLESPLVRSIRQAAPGTVKIEPLDVRDWSYDNGAYKIERKYRITTDEAVWEVPFTISSLEAEAEGGKRKWRVEPNPFMNPLEPVSWTPLGQTRAGLRKSSFDFLSDPRYGWFTNLRMRRGVEFLLATRTPAERPAWKARLVTTPIVATAGVAAAPTEPKAVDRLLAKLPSSYLGLDEAAQFFKTDGLRVPGAPDATIPTKIREALAKTLEPERLPSLVVKMQEDKFVPCAVEKGRLQVSHEFEMLVTISLEQRPLNIVLLGRAVVVGPENLDPNAAGADQQWRVDSVEVFRAVPVSPKQGPPGGPG